MLKTTILTVVVLSSTVAFSQISKPCNLTLAKAPIIRGLRLGMSVSEAGNVLGLQLYPNDVNTGISYVRSTNQFLPDSAVVGRELIGEYRGNLRSFKLGNKSVELGWNYIQKIKEPLRQNIAGIKLEFFKDTLESITVSYSFSKPIWNGRAEIVRIFSARAGIPPSWKNNVKDTASTIDCSGFNVVVDERFRYEGQSPLFVQQFSLVLTDQKARQDLDALAKQRWVENKAAEERSKKEFLF